MKTFPEISVPNEVPQQVVHFALHHCGNCKYQTAVDRHGCNACAAIAACSRVYPGWVPHTLGSLLHSH